MNTEPIPMEAPESHYLAEQHEEVVVAYTRIAALARITLGHLEVTEATRKTLDSDFALVRGALGLNERNRWND